MVRGTHCHAFSRCWRKAVSSSLKRPCQILSRSLWSCGGCAEPASLLAGLLFLCFFCSAVVGSWSFSDSVRVASVCDILLELLSSTSESDRMLLSLCYVGLLCCCHCLRAVLPTADPELGFRVRRAEAGGISSRAYVYGLSCRIRNFLIRYTAKLYSGK